MPDNFLDLITLGMGNSKSKHKERYGRTKKNPSANSSNARDAKKSSNGSRDRVFSAEIHERFAEDEELKILRHTINHKPELFILNNLMMSIQFFENYDEEIANIRNSTVSTREAELNTRLPPQRHTLIPDVLQQHVAQRVHFTYINPMRKSTIELLHPIRIYVVFDNIEITENNVVQYSAVNETIYNLQLKPSPSHKGYILLQRLEENSSKKTASTDSLDMVSNSTREDIYSDGDSAYGTKSNANGAVDLSNLVKINSDANYDEDSVYGVRRYGSQENIFEYPSTSARKDESIYDAPATKSDHRGVGTKNPNKIYGKQWLLRSANGSQAGSTSSGYRSGINMDSDSEYSYPMTSKSSSDGGSMIYGTELPGKCFKKIVYGPDGKIYDRQRMKKQVMTNTDHLVLQRLKSQNYKIYYLSSKRFMTYFWRIFADQLAVPMGFVPKKKSDSQGTAIYRTIVETLEDKTSTKVEHFEIVPTVRGPWPECAQEWFDRPRATWPSYNVIEWVKRYGCNMIPETVITDTPDDYHDLEWQLVFPAAESYLETCLTYPQVRVYLTALMLHKIFIRPVDSIFGLTVSHIKNQMFWMIEEDDRPSMWMEHRTGESLIKLLKKLYDTIKQDTPNLPDYFVKERNLLQGTSSLLSTQKQLNRILGNPVMFVFHAMEKIVHSPNFFPRLDFVELLRILTADTLTLANPALASQVPRQIGRANRKENDYQQVGGIWEKNERDNEPETIYERKPVNIRSLINTRQDVNRVVDISVRCEKLEPRRMSFLLDFFIRHFIKMAEKCHNYRALRQKVAYIDQAERLSVLLLEHPTHKDIAKIYLEKLCALKRRAPRTRSQTAGVKSPTPPPEPPETPRRNPAICVRPLTQRHEVSIESHEGQRNYVRIPQTGETKEYELGSTTSSVYNLQSPPGARDKRTVVTIHEEITQTVETRKPCDVTSTSEEAILSNGKTRIVSIVDTQDESFLTETTYI